MTANAAARFRLGYQVLHHLADVLDIETGTVEGAVSRHCAQYLADRLDSAFAYGICTFHHEGCGPHADNHAVPAAVKGNSGLFNHFISSCRSRSKKAGAKPFEHMVGSDVVG
jgi:hypothetical protein